MRRLVLLVALWLAPCAPLSAQSDIWADLRAGGTVVLVRHAAAPGSGDPPGFRIDDCATQRNLSDEGRRQAVRIGERLRREQVPVARVLSSGWCRALETARLAFGAAEREPALDSFFGARERGDAQTRRLRSIILGWPAQGGNLMMVTHQVNITALTGVFPADGEAIAVRGGADGRIRLVGRIRP